MAAKTRTAPAGITTQLARDELASPIGTLRLYATEAGLLAIGLPGHDARAIERWVRRVVPDSQAAGRRALEEPARQLEEYFAGKRHAFALRLDVRGTAFQQTVWREVAGVTYGQRATYAQIARRVGRPKAVRAVGVANGANPLPIVIPCHRIVGSNGSLTGYGGGLAAKAWLLEHEATHARPLVA
ncbi:MAG: methylated-DNA--[protein]-cysteine S-methyltransferase [Chloroflexi bacterium]|nr:methylated-DNA--[protein]-cysteine S-methyltransferase [Chloroflexota bacterium]